MTDLMTFLDQPTAIVGTTGAGKTIVAKFAAELLLRADRRVIIIDPTGAWWGLRSGADGSPEGGLPVTIFGGDHADVPIAPTGDAGKALALALAERHVQAIIDISEMTGGEKNRFLTPFLENLYAKNKAALHLIVDEADEVAAQRPADGEQRLLGAFDKIVRRGRIKGFRPLMISQRPAVIHKNVLSQIGTLVAMKLTSPQDRKAIEEWVKGNADGDQAKAVMSSLQGLDRGEGWLWSPAAGILSRTRFPMITTFDSSRTPQTGETVVAPALSAVDVAALREALKVEEPSTETAITYVPSVADLERAAERGYERGYREGRNYGYQQACRRQMSRVAEALVGASMLVGVGEAFAEAMARIDGVAVTTDPLEQPHSAVQVSTTPPIDTMKPETQAAVRDMVVAAALGLSTEAPAASEFRDRDGRILKIPARAIAPKSAKIDGLSAGAAALLAAIDTKPFVTTPWPAIAMRAGYVESGGGFRRARKELMEAGRVRLDDDCPAPENPTGTGTIPTREQLVATWQAKLGGTPGNLLGIIAEAGGHIPIGMLANQAGMVAAGGGFRRALKQLRTSGIVEASGPDVAFTRAFVQAAGE